MIYKSIALLILLIPGIAFARWPTGTTERVSRHLETIEVAASMFDVDSVLLAAICSHETGLQPLRGGTNKSMYGPCQVHWDTWGTELQRAGIASRPEDLLEPDMISGLLAGAYVISEINSRRYRWKKWRRVCAYGTGGRKAATFNESCGYGDAVAANSRKALIVMAASRAMRNMAGNRSTL